MVSSRKYSIPSGQCNSTCGDLPGFLAQPINSHFRETATWMFLYVKGSRWTLSPSKSYKQEVGGNRYCKITFAAVCRKKLFASWGSRCISGDFTFRKPLLLHSSVGSLTWTPPRRRMPLVLIRHCSRCCRSDSSTEMFPNLTAISSAGMLVV